MLSITTLSTEALRTAVTELDRCLYNHDQWLDALFGTLICGLRADEPSTSSPMPIDGAAWANGIFPKRT